MHSHHIKVVNQKNKVETMKRDLASNTGAHPHDKIQCRMNIILAQANLGLLITSKHN
jgi:hypothetical protein